MEIEMKYILEIYKTGSFSKAAENLYMTQPALSMAIGKIEKDIGMSIFNRKKHPLRLTEAGEIYVNSILQIMQIEEKRLNQIHDIEELRTGRLRIGGTHYVNAYILPEVLKIYNEKYPGVQIELMEAGSNTLSRMLKERNIDITFSCDEKLVKQFDNYPAFEDHILLAVHESEPICSEMSAYALEYDDIRSKKHIDENCPTVSMKKFEKIPFVLLTPGNNLYYRAKEIFLNYDINPDIKLEVSQMATAYHLSAVNYGSTFVSDRMIVSKEAPLKYFKLNSNLARRQFYALLKNQEYTPKAVKAFIMLIQDKFALI